MSLNVSLIFPIQEDENSLVISNNENKQMKKKLAVIFMFKVAYRPDGPGVLLMYCNLYHYIMYTHVTVNKKKTTTNYYRNVYFRIALLDLLCVNYHLCHLFSIWVANHCKAIINFFFFYVPDPRFSRWVATESDSLDRYLLFF
jgi:hypothetical protein